MNRIKIIVGVCMLLTVQYMQAQKVYTNSAGEVIFSAGQLSLNENWVTANSTSETSPEISKHPVRFSMFLHFSEFVHMDLGNNIGLFSGIGIRNIGMISDEVLPKEYGSGEFLDIKVIRRVYALNIPLAIKLGSFKDHFYFYGGGEINWNFHYKEKYWTSHSRSGSKSKYSVWWPSQVETIQPCVFAGIQFPKGINVKATYYPSDFLNHDYSRNSVNNGTDKVVSDLSKYKESQLFSISLTWHFNKSNPIKDSDDSDEVEEVAYY